MSPLPKTPSWKPEYLLKVCTVVQKAFERELAGFPTVFSLRGPEKLTVKNSKGQYKKQGFIGDEGFIGKGAYVGRSGKVICVFTPSSYGGDFVMEMSIEDAAVKLSGFRDFLAGMWSVDEDATVSEIRDEVSELETAAHLASTKNKYEEDPRYGSW